MGRHCIQLQFISRRLLPCFHVHHDVVHRLVKVTVQFNSIAPVITMLRLKLITGPKRLTWRGSIRTGPPCGLKWALRGHVSCCTWPRYLSAGSVAIATASLILHVPRPLSQEKSTNGRLWPNWLGWHNRRTKITAKMILIIWNVSLY